MKSHIYELGMLLKGILQANFENRLVLWSLATFLHLGLLNKNSLQNNFSQIAKPMPCVEL